MEKSYRIYKLTSLPKAEADKPNSPLKLILEEGRDNVLRESFETVEGCKNAILQSGEIATDYVILPILNITY